MCHTLLVFMRRTQASSVPNVLDCLYRLELKSYYQAVGGAAPISLRVRTPDAAYGTRRAQLA
jgi:hypothetical protein